MTHKHTLFAAKLFRTKDNRLIEATAHVAGFDGLHNASKSKCLIVLYHRKYNLNQNNGISAIELHRQTGVCYGYIRSRLARWVEWEYIKREIDIQNGKPVYFYSIDTRGRHFVEDIIPADARNRYIEEIKTFKNSLTAKSDGTKVQ